MAGGDVRGDERARRFSRLLVSLYKGVLYKEKDEALWRDLDEFSDRVIDHFAPLGLRLVKDDEAGLAFVRYPPDEGEDEAGIPRLVARRRLSYGVSLMLVLLRGRMAEFERQGAETRLILTADEIAEMLRPYQGETTNEARLKDRCMADLNKVKEMGFVRQLKEGGEVYEVMRIIKAYVDAQWLEDFSEKLEAYREFGKEGGA